MALVTPNVVKADLAALEDFESDFITDNLTTKPEFSKRGEGGFGSTGRF